MKPALLSLALAMAFQSFAQPPSDLQQSHIEANVPENKDFQAFLNRDLLAYLRGKQSGVGDDIRVELLRDAATQSGVSYPKYYAWITFKVGVMKQERGVVRLAAIEKRKFEVTDFISEAQIKANSQALERVFPASLVPTILAKAGLL